MDTHTISLLLGTFVGILLALTGAGGGIISVPLLVFALHLSIAEASPISLLAIFLAAGGSAVLGLREGIVRYKAAVLMAGCGAMFSPLGVWLAQRLPDAWLTVIFAFVLAFVSLRMFRHATPEMDVMRTTDDKPPPPCQIDKVRGKLKWTAPCALSITAAGSLAGLLSGLLGVGGGFVIVPALRGVTNLDIKSIVATSLAVIAVVSASSLMVVASHGLVRWDLAWPFSIGAVGGMLAGKALAHHLTGPRVQQSFAALSLFVAAGLLCKLAL
jgi:uncharacterized membrane protein YfcA